MFSQLKNWWFFFRLKNGWLPAKKTTQQDRIVMALMTVLDPDSNIGITARAAPEALEYLKSSDNPFAGYVISCLVESNAESAAHFDDWLQKTIDRATD